jgi:Sec-independent protein translocase protein TatA
MEILGVGPLELLFIFLIALIVLGPQDMKKAGLTLGRFLRKIITSQGWRDFQQGWRNLRYLPNKMMREAGLEEDVKSINESMKEFQKLKPAFDTSALNKELKETEKDISSWLTPPTIASPPPPTVETIETSSQVATDTPPAAPETETTSTSSSESGSENA